MMRNKQSGMTTMGLIVLVAVLGLIVFGIIQLIPVYLENMKVVKVLNQTQQTLGGRNVSKMDILNTIEKRLDIEYLNEFDIRKDFEVKRAEGGYSVSIDYERRRAYIANVYLLAEFDHSVVITR
jgi:hypothetical protein